MSLETLRAQKEAFDGQNQAKALQTQEIKDNLSLMREYFTQDYAKLDLLNPFVLMPRVIALAKSHHLSLCALKPYPHIHALAIEGKGEFEEIKELLKMLEEIAFLSVENIGFTHFADSQSPQIGFSMLVVDYRSDIFALIDSVYADFVGGRE